MFPFIFYYELWEMQEIYSCERIHLCFPNHLVNLMTKLVYVKYNNNTQW